MQLSLLTVIVFFRYFEDVTLSAGVDMDSSFRGSSLNRGTYSFASSFTVSWHAYVLIKRLHDYPPEHAELCE